MEVDLTYAYFNQIKNARFIVIPFKEKREVFKNLCYICIVVL